MKEELIKRKIEIKRRIDTLKIEDKCLSMEIGEFIPFYKISKNDLFVIRMKLMRIKKDCGMAYQILEKGRKIIVTRKS